MSEPYRICHRNILSIKLMSDKPDTVHWHKKQLELSWFSQSIYELKITVVIFSSYIFYTFIFKETIEKINFNLMLYMALLHKYLTL